MTTPQDDERTVLARNASPAPGGNALPVGTRILEFEITALLGEGGFGIVYLAYDSSLQRKVALKEYMPASFASRSATQVSVKSREHEETFLAGLRSFVNEARILAQFDHPALIKVYRFWEANGTAYMVMPYYQGLTLKQTLLSRAKAPDEAWLKALLSPLLHTLALIHEQQCFHRDISPDNIMMLEGGGPLLLDFGAARRAISGRQQDFTVIFKHGYAPVEQYADVPGMLQGPWTDMFALACVIHFAIDGKPPPPAIGRMMADSYEPLATRFAQSYSAAFLQAIDLALSVKPEQRPQSAKAMLALLDLDTVAPAPIASPALEAQSPAAPAPEGSQPRHRRPSTIGGAVAIGILAVVLLITFARRDPAPQAQKIPAQVQQPALASPPASAPVAPVPFDPLVALAKVVDGASASRSVTVTAAQTRVQIGRDSLKFSVTASHAGYLYIQMIGSDRNNFYLLFPNAFDKNNRIAAGQTLDLPRKGWRLGVEGPAGVDEFVVILSDVRRDFSAAGLVAGQLFGEFPIARAAALHDRYTGATPLFAGSTVCVAGSVCSPVYGASRFSIEEYAP